ncbi:MAG: hypothetical protein WBV55_20830 [Candidatus Sulfotelmatobacter sp.]
MRAISGWRVVGAALSLLSLSGFVLAQTPASGSTVPAATVTFTLDFPLSDPTYYSIAVDANGHASYECTVKDQEDSEEQLYRAEFNVSAANRQRIFDWTKQAKYFAGKVDSGNRKLAFTGDKILSYQDGKQSYTARYNYSSLEPVRELTALFQSMESTLDYGRRLAYYHRYQKLALDDELKRMEAQARNNELSEIQSVEPVLQSIVEDNSVINMVRARAKALIQMENDAGER